MFCTKCGSELSAGAAFCTRCGQPVDGSAPAKQNTPQATVAVQRPAMSASPPSQKPPLVVAPAQPAKKSHRRRNLLIALFVIVFIIVAAAASSPQNPSPNTTTQSQQVIPSTCEFSHTNATAVSAPQSFNFEDCLTAGSSHGYGFGVTGSSVSSLSGTVVSSFPVRVQVLAGGLFGGVLYDQNDTTSAHFSNLQVLEYTGYTVYITNLGQNNSVTVNVEFS